MKKLALLVLLSGCGANHEPQVLMIAPNCPINAIEHIRAHAARCVNTQDTADGIEACFNKAVGAYCYRLAWSLEE